MLHERVFVFGNQGYTNDSVKIVVPEITTPDFGMYTWPSAPVLAQYIWFNREKLEGKTILELSAGTALPGLLASRCGARVVLSDNPDFPRCLENTRRSCKLNNMEEIPVYCIKWGSVEGDILSLPKLDLIIASDCFYDTNDFEDIVVTVAFLLEQNKGAEFLFSYQERSSSRSIEHLLFKWNLKAQVVNLSSFDGHASNIAGSDLPGNHVVKMFKISENTQT